MPELVELALVAGILVAGPGLARRVGQREGELTLAGLQQVPGELYEAADIDGASNWRKFWSITLPLITPVLFFNLVLGIINSFQAFTSAYIVSGGTGGPADSTMFYTLYLYQQGFSNFRMGYASAMGWVLLAIIAAFTAVNFLASRKWVFYGDER